MGKKLVTEFIGTFFLVFVIALSVNSGASAAIAPIAIGLSLMVGIYMGGWVSGAHYNPAVSIAAWMRGALPTTDLVPYIISQAAGAAAAGGISGFLLNKHFLPRPAGTLMEALIVELAFTFLLCLVVLNVATVKRTSGNSYYGAAIGMTVTAGAVAGGGISGGAYNPGVVIGGLVSSVSDLKDTGTLFTSIAAYIATQVVAAILAASIFKMQNAGEAN